MSKMTLDKLATIVASGFEKVERRFNQVDKKFSQVDKKLDKKTDELALMTARGFEQVDKHFARVELDNHVIRDNLSEVQQSLSFVKTEVKETNSRLGDLSYKVGKLTKSNKEDLNAFGKDILLIKQKVGLK